MHILIIEVQPFTPHLDSGSNRLYNIIFLLKKLVNKITFISDFNVLEQSEIDEYCLNGVHCLNINGLNSSTNISNLVGKKVDVIYYSKIYSFINFSQFTDIYPNAKIIYDTVDLHHIRFYKRAKLTNNPEYISLALKMKKKEKEAALLADYTLTVSNVEKEKVLNLAPGVRVETISNIHSTIPDKIEYKGRNSLLFIGSFKHAPNVDAVQFLLEDIFPNISQKYPQLKLKIIGKNPPSHLLSTQCDKIHFLGFVKELSPCFKSIIASIVPIRFGAGVKGKILTSWSMGVPVITTREGCEGLQYGEEFPGYRAETPQMFTQAIGRLLKNREEWYKHSKRGKQIINQHYSTDKAIKSFCKILE